MTPRVSLVHGKMWTAEVIKNIYFHIGKKTFKQIFGSTKNITQRKKHKKAKKTKKCQTQFCTFFLYFAIVNVHRVKDCA